MGAARDRRHRHRGAAAGRRALPLPADLAPMVEDAREAGLGVTIHVGEEGGEDGLDEIGEVVEPCAPTGSATGSSRPATRS